MRLSTTTLYTRQQAANVSGGHVSEYFLEWAREFRDTLKLEEQEKRKRAFDAPLLYVGRVQVKRVTS